MRHFCTCSKLLMPNSSVLNDSTVPQQQQQQQQLYVLRHMLGYGNKGHTVRSPEVLLVVWDGTVEVRLACVNPIPCQVLDQVPSYMDAITRSGPARGIPKIKQDSRTSQMERCPTIYHSLHVRRWWWSTEEKKQDERTEGN